LLCTVVWAGITGSISGLVTDPTGAVVAGAQVAVTEIQTGVRTEVATDAKGFYDFPTLAIGTYELEVHQPGFKTFRQTNIVIDANSAVKVDVSLQVGTTSENVEVRSDAVQVETQNTQMGEVITGTRMTSVPLNGRAYTDLLSLQPGVVPSAYGSTAPGLNDRSPSGAPGASGGAGLNSGNQSVNGQRETANGFMVNGANVEEGKNNGTSIVPNLDAIAEFRIITNNFDAEYGNFSGGQVNVATKSGTNEIHGSAFEFFRNTALDARNFFNPADTGPKGKFDQNQFGGTVGGPLKKDKLFFFFDYQATRQTTGSTINTPVPSDADRTGDVSDLFSAIAASGGTAGTVSSDYWAGVLQNRLQTSTGQQVVSGEPYWTPTCNSTDPVTGCVFPKGVIPQSAWSPVSANFLTYIPSSNTSIGNYSTSAYNNTLHDNKGGIRIDDNTRFGMLSAYYFIDDYTENDAYPNSGATVPGFNSISTGRAQLIQLGSNKSFGTSSVNEFRFSYTRNALDLFAPDGGLGKSLSSLGFTVPNCPANDAPAGCVFNGGVGPIDPKVEGVPNVSFNTFSIGIPVDTVRQFNNTFQWQDVFSKVLGTHSFKFGGGFHYDQINERNLNSENGSFNFNGIETGSDFADFLIGATNSFTQASRQILDSRTKYLGLFVQDSWRFRPSLTFNYGLRYEISTPFYDTQNKTETIIPGEQSVVFPGAPTGWLVPGDPGVPRTLAPVKYDAFSPRIGLAYSPNFKSHLLASIFGGPGKTSIRAGFGIYYTSVEDLSQFLEVGDPPYGIYWGSVSPPVFESPYLSRNDGQVETVSGGNPFPFVFPPSNVSAKNPDANFPWENVEPISYGWVFDPKNRLPYSEHYELAIQRQLGASTVLSTSYVGNQGHRLVTAVEANPGSPALCNFLSNPANLAPGVTPCGPWGENSQYQLAPGVTPPAGIPIFYVPGTNNTVIAGTRTTLNPYYFGSNPYEQETANSAYNSFQINVRHNSSRADVMIGYTFSKCMDNSSGLQVSTNPLDPKLSRSLCLFDVTNNFVGSYTYNFQFERLFHADHGAANKLSQGWALSGITTFATGLPISLSENDDNSELGINAAPLDTPELTGTRQIIDNKNPRTGQPYINPAAFTFETVGQLGNANRQFFHGPGLNNWDMALLKNTNFSESKILQLRFEAFNVFNHAQFINPSGSINSGLPVMVDGVNEGGTFGMVTSARAPRIMQIAVKFLF
jgi:Carboxypeptidase regulatory-like domain/TonB dependent receptor